MTRVTVTGGSGVVGRLIRPGLQKRFAQVHHLSSEPLGELAANESETVGDLRDYDAVRRAIEGADLVIHLGGISTEGPFDPMIEVNIGGTHHVLEAARSLATTPSLLIASSAHVVGAVPVEAAAGLPSELTHAHSAYGVSKVAVEALAHMYAWRYAIPTVIARIGTALDRPRTVRHLSTWLSPDDFLRLVDATLAWREPRSHTLWAVSQNTRRWVDLEAGRQIGFQPQDDSELWAAELLADPTDSSMRWDTLGGPWSEPGPHAPPKRGAEDATGGVREGG